MPLDSDPTLASAGEVAAVRRLGAMLAAAPGYQHMAPRARAELDAAVAKISGFLGGDPAFAAALSDPRLARQMAPDLRARLSAESQPAPGAPAPAPAHGTGTAAAPPPGGGPVGRVGEVARATLNAINFPEFVASLIQGTFQAIVDASIQQMEAYAELLKNVAGTVDRFMQDNISDGVAKDHLVDQYDGLFARDTSGGMPRLVVQQQGGAELPSFFKELGFDTPQQIDDRAVEDVIVPATRRQLAERRQQTLATMVLMGINRVVVRDGEINAKLIFHIDASETSQLKFDQHKISNGNMSGYAGRNPFGASAVMVNTASINAQSAINVRADLTGQVTVRFASETFPLERFADSAAIQLINQNAKVPQAPAAAAPTGPGTAPAIAAPPPQAGVPAAAPATPPAATAPAAPKPPAPAAQGLAAADPWAP